MTKQEQIEQLAKDINMINSLPASSVYPPSYQEALCLYNLSYRKIDDNSVVMSQKDYNKMIDMMQCINEMLMEEKLRTRETVLDVTAKILADMFDCPCNFTPLDEEMGAYCGENCQDDDKECWRRVLEKKL